MRIATLLVPVAALCTLAGCQTPRQTPVPGATGSRLYSGLDRYHVPITTDSLACQQWFDQGVQWMFGFNHDEAARSFEEAAARDPDAPMPWWGIAICQGMNINDHVVTPERWRKGNDAVRQAKLRLDNASELERALIEAADARFTWPDPKSQRKYDESYADAMEGVYERFGANPLVGVLYAESLMNLQPWDYWTLEGEPKGRITEVVSVLEDLLEREPDHPGAAHLYIHAVEASHDPDRALPYARRLQTRVPGSGHLVHMPSHIYIRTGMYSDAADANIGAVAADEAYLDTDPPAAFYWIYYAHNLHFLAYASMMECRYEVAIEAARKLDAALPIEMQKEVAPLIEGILATHYHVMVRFGKWEEILEEPLPAEHRLMTRAVHHYARGIAFSALGRTDEARQAHADFEAAVAEVPQDWMMFNNPVHTVLPIARAMLDAELAFREGRLEDAWAAFELGVAAEDALIYDEPPGWMLPVRHAYGALLMSAGEYERAEAVYRTDLEKNRDNGWSLLGLQLALEAQNRGEEAAEFAPRVNRAWSRADTTATSSCMCEPGAG